jgi:peptidylprolyl isomerase
MSGMSRGLIAIFVACAALAVAGCGSDSSTTTGGESSSPAKSESSISTNTNVKPEVTVPSGPPPKKLTEVEVVEGTGPEAKSGDQVTVQYVGVGYESGEEFDSSWSRNEPFSFGLGAGEVIAGWDQGVAGMKVGGRRELIIPSQLAYGPTGSPPSIGPNETLIFVIDLLAVE